MLDSFQWPTPDGPPDEILFRNVREHGCHLMGIGGDAQSPAYVFSIGLYLNYAHPELVLFGLETGDACNIINTVRDRAAAGQTYAAGDVTDDFWSIARSASLRCRSALTGPGSAPRSGSMQSCRGRFPACRSCGRTRRATFPGKRAAIPS